MTGGRNDPDPWLLDAHCDTWYMQEFFRGPNLPSEMQGIDAEAFFCVTPGRLREGRVGCVFANVGDIGIFTSSAIIDNLHALAADKRARVAICHGAGEVRQAVRSEKTALVMACEGAFLFRGRLDLLRNWHRLGVRVVTLTHGEGQDGLGWFPSLALAQEPQVLADSSFALQGTPTADRYLTQKERRDLIRNERGLTPFGQSVVAEMIRLNMVCDLSHANDAAFCDVMAIADKAGAGKFCCTHSNCAALCGHTRNITDDMMEALAGCGGVMGLCFFGEFIDEQNPSLARYVDHVLHAIDVMGEAHVGIGSDFDGVQPGAFMAIPHPGRTGMLWAALSDAGLSKAVLKKIAHENFLRLLQE